MLAFQGIRALALTAVFALAGAALTAPVSAQDPSGLDFGDDGDPALDGLRSFLDLAGALDASPGLAGLPPAERPVLLRIAREAHAEPAEVLRLRLRGRRWHAILEHYGLSPNIFRVPLEAEDLGGAYRRLYRYSPSEWDEIYLSDQDYIDLAQLERAYAHHREPLAEALRLEAERRSSRQLEAPLSERHRRRQLERQRQERILAEQREEDRRAAQRLTEQREEDRRAAQRLAEQREADRRAAQRLAEQREADRRAEEERARQRRAVQTP